MIFILIAVLIGACMIAIQVRYLLLFQRMLQAEQRSGRQFASFDTPSFKMVVQGALCLLFLLLAWISRTDSLMVAAYIVLASSFFSYFILGYSSKRFYYTEDGFLHASGFIPFTLVKEITRSKQLSRIYEVELTSGEVYYAEKRRAKLIAEKSGLTVDW